MYREPTLVTVGQATGPAIIGNVRAVLLDRHEPLRAFLRARAPLTR